MECRRKCDKLPVGTAEVTFWLELDSGALNYYFIDGVVVIVAPNRYHKRLQAYFFLLKHEQSNGNYPKKISKTLRFHYSKVTYRK
jgi:hypothetical protein